MKKINFFVLLLIAGPAISLANQDDDKGLSGVIETLTNLANSIYGLILTLIIIAFAWGVLKFVFQSGDDQKKGKDMMIWSIIAITVLFSIWGIVNLFTNTFGIENNEIEPPSLPTINN